MHRGGTTKARTTVGDLAGFPAITYHNITEDSFLFLQC